MEIEKKLYTNLKPFLSCKDYTVSGKNFQVNINQEYEMLVTTPVPEKLEDFYESENYISHTDSKKSVLDKVYQKVKNITLQQKLKLINSFNTPQKNILDVGAGTGDFLKYCSNNNWNILGVEPSFKARDVAHKKGVYLKDDLYKIESSSFDVITLWHVLEHVRDLKNYIKKLKALLSENGYLVIAVPNYKSFDAKLYKEHWAAFDVPRHLWHFSQESIHKLFAEVQMKVVQTKPMKFDAYYVSLLSEKYKTKKMNPVKAFYNGFRSNLKAKRNSEYSSLIYVIKNQ
ncbi:class I SAM-dependent methyltransferase [Polaribacter sp.]|uniref:class I SAM-dependent methyltransferase n=1 Tax=Polaribacter sp. TaxID=1920175 RepID=UPI003F6C7603